MPILSGTADLLANRINIKKEELDLKIEFRVAAY
jgi:hypothetical protein